MQVNFLNFYRESQEMAACRVFCRDLFLATVLRLKFTVELPHFSAGIGQ
jgi:hypothetical protein